MRLRCWLLAVVLFRPADPIAAVVRGAIDASTRSVHAALYQLDLVPLAEALVRARARGAEVRVVLDTGALSPRDSVGRPLPMPAAVKLLMDAGVPVRWMKGAPPHGSMHTKFAVFDGGRAVDGSFNWTATAETLHYENLEFLDEKEVVMGLDRYFEYLWMVAGEKQRLAPRPPAIRMAGGALMVSPGGGAEEAIADAMRDCETSIEVAMFSFYSFAIAKAMVGAHRRGVAVRVVMDLDQAADSPVTEYLRRAGVPVRFLAGPGGPGPHSRMHHKFAVFDGRRLENGSFNFSPNAERRSFETVRFSAEPARVGAFAAEFARLWEAAQN